MIDQMLTLSVCGLFTLILVVVAAILGNLYRKKLANRIMAGLREGGFMAFSTKQGGRKIRRLSLLTLLSMTGIFVIFYLVWADILLFDSIWAIAFYMLFVLIGIIAGALLFKQVLDRLRQ